MITEEMLEVGCVAAANKMGATGGGGSLPIGGIAAALEAVAPMILEEAARLCDKELLLQHPMKPLGVAISSEPAAPAHASAIRALAPSGEGEGK